ncbi:MAG: DUF302 domain-containing protein [Candidatus Omnitrophica bacterium]|nr:DUF302 domain-containing protein [Candidatus Omnitrophota bacterium]
MSYYLNKVLKLSFGESIQKVSEELKKEGFGIITEIDVQATLKKKININFRSYRILGACNPSFAYQALQVEDKIGTMLPCNIIVQCLDEKRTEVAAIDPVSAMGRMGNQNLLNIAQQVQSKLRKVIEAL